MEELLKYAIESGSFGVSLFLSYILFKRFIKNEVVEPIKKIETEHEKLKSSFEKFSDNVSSFIFRIMKSHGDLIDTVGKDITKMHSLFSEVTRHTSQAKKESYEALEKVNVLEHTADKLLKATTMVHDQNKVLKSEVTKISNDLILVKNKLKVGHED